MLNMGAPQQVDFRSNDKMAVVLQEILQDKIYLDVTGEVQTTDGAPAGGAPEDE